VSLRVFTPLIRGQEKSMNASSTSRRLQFENLESRRLMAGNVSVGVSYNGELLITGDMSGNGVEVRQVGSGQYRVIGTMHAGAQTKIVKNGVAANSQLLTGVTSDFEIDLKERGDRLLMSAAGLRLGVRFRVPNDLNIAMDGAFPDRGPDGNDRVNLSNVQVMDDAQILLGAGNDIVSLDRCVIGGTRASIDNNLRIYADEGSDYVSIAKTYVRNVLHVDMSGTSEIESNYVFITDSTIKGRVFIIGGQGYDRVSISQSTMDQPVNLSSGNGNDHVSFSHITANALYVNMGAGDSDYARIEFSTCVIASFDGGVGDSDNFDLGPGNSFTTFPNLTDFEL